jgi:hypothetical protein
MRNFDNWTCYRDLKGNILRGCVQFNVKGGNTTAPIFDRNGTAIANPQITDILGRTQHQVFIDEDVTAYFYKYVGDGTIAAEEAQGIDTSDVSRWALQFTCDNVLAFGASFDSLSAMEIGTMSALRTIDPESVPNVGGVKEIILGGYYEAGDCAQVRYILDSESVDADDNGSVIKCNDLLTGRWILVRPDGFVDSRHFGVFPQYTQLADVDHTTRITQLVNYCNAAGLNPLFSGSVSHPYFIYGSLNVSSRNSISVSKGTAFVDKSDSYFYGDWDGNPYFVNGRTKVSSHSVRASWNFSDAITYDEIYLDAQTPKAAFVDARVVVTVDTAGKTFTNCEIVSDGHLADNIFNNCVLRASMFTNESLSPTIDDDCTIQPLDFADRMDLWCVLRSQQNDPVIDVCMQTLDSHCTIALEGVFIKNALFDNFEHDAKVSLGFESCRGTVTVNAIGNFDLTVEDSELNIDISGTGEIGVGFQPIINARNSTMAMNASITYLLALAAVNTTFSVGPIIVNGDVAIEGCNVSVPLTMRGKFTAYNSTIVGYVLHYTVNAIAEVEMVGNTLKNYYELRPSIAGTVVHGVWANNYSSVDSPIILDRTNIDPVDSNHTYTYANNSGGFLQYVTKKETHTFTIKHVENTLFAATDPYVLNQTLLGNPLSMDDGWFGRLFPWYDMTHNFDTVRMFRIGVDRFRINAKLTDIGNALLGLGTNLEYALAMPVEASLGAYFVDGYTFGIRPWFDDPTDWANLSAESVSPVIMKGSRTFKQTGVPEMSDYSVSMSISYECMDRHDR